MGRRVSTTTVIVVLSVVLLLPSLRLGFLLDDYLFLAALDGNLPGRTAGENLFSLIEGDPARAAEMAKDGYLPWWVEEDVKFVFFRPLSELLMRVDHVLFGQDALGWHVHSLLWWIATVLSAGLLLRHALPGEFGAMALLLFALDESHALPAAWISNRNALVALAPAFAAVWAHARWREKEWNPGRFLSPAAFALALLGGEIALGALAYVAAYEVVHPRRWRERLAGMAPTALLGLAYLTFHRLAGYGAAGSAIYLDPSADPLGFLSEVPGRALALLAGGIVGFQADSWSFGPAWQRAQSVIGLLAIGIVLLAFRACSRRVDAATRRSLAWLVHGAALSLVPSLATFPSDRLLLPAAPGIAALIGTTLVLGWRAFREKRARALQAGAAGFAVSHLLLAPTLVLLIQLFLTVQNRSVVQIARSPALAEARDAQVILPTSPDYVIGNYLPLVMVQVAPVRITGWRALSQARSDHVLLRRDSRTLELEVVDGTMMQTLFEKLYRRDPLPPGTVLHRGTMTVEILEAVDGAPKRVAFRFDRELEDPSLVFLEWTGSSVERMAIPAVGESRRMVRRIGPTGF